jgi:hypothetical protein
MIIKEYLFSPFNSNEMKTLMIEIIVIMKINRGLLSLVLFVGLSQVRHNPILYKLVSAEFTVTSFGKS